jgi:hypothetical protein
MEARLKMSKESKTPEVDATEYKGIIGGLCYLIHTRLTLRTPWVSSAASWRSLTKNTWS